MTTRIQRTLVTATVAALLTAACTTQDQSAGGGLILEPTRSTGSTQPTQGSTDPATSSSELESALNEIVGDTGVPAIGAAMFDHEGLVDVAVSGVRRRGDPTEVTIDDTFHIGSNTKAMTAALLARLSEQNRGISFDTTLAEAFPAIDSMHDGYADVTMAQLLSHTGGAPGDDVDIDETILSMPVAIGRAAGTELVLSQPPATTPSTTVEYSNAGYVIAAAAMEQATGSSWEELMVTEIFTPLGMDSCAFGPPGTEGQADQPSGHDGDGQPVYWDIPPLVGPAGSVHCSMGDWGRFLVELLNGNHGSSDYLTRDSIDAIFKPAAIAVDDASGIGSAAGWLVIDGPDGPDGPGYFHDGSNTAWYSQALILPRTDRVVLAVTNEELTGQEAAGRAFAALADLDTGS